MKNTKITPSRKKPVVALTTGRYQSAAASIFSFSKTHNHVLAAAARQIHNKMKELCSLNHNSLLRSDHEVNKHFSWVAIFEELVKKVPTLVKFIQKLLPSSSNTFISALICIMVKQRCIHVTIPTCHISVAIWTWNKSTGT